VTLPRTRADCARVPRPCPFVTCKWSLVSENKGKSPESCALDIADRGGSTLEEVAAAMGITSERVHQLEKAARRKIRERLPRHVRELLREDRIEVDPGLERAVRRVG
jgi:hypothetical protein